MLIIFCFLITIYIVFLLLQKRVSVKNSRISSFSQLEVYEILDKLEHYVPLILKQSFSVQNLLNCGLKINYPLYVVYSINLTMEKINSLCFARLIKPFNLIVFLHEDFDRTKLESVFYADVKFYYLDSISKNLREHILNLAVNFGVRRDVFYHNKISNFCLVNNSGKTISSSYKEFFIYHTYQQFDISFTALENNYYFIKSQRKHDLEIFLQIPVDKFDYFYVKKEKCFYKIYSILNNFSVYLFCSKTLKNIEILTKKHSNDLIIKFTVINAQKIFFTVGKSIHELQSISNLNAEIVKSILANKLANFYSFSLKSSSKFLDFYINSYLPNQAILSSLKFEENFFNTPVRIYEKPLGLDEVICLLKSKAIRPLQAYYIIKEMFIKHLESGAYLIKNPLKDKFKLTVQHNSQTKQFLVSNTGRTLLQMDGVNYYNISIIPAEILKTNSIFKLNIST